MEDSITNAESKVWETVIWKAEQIVKENFNLKKEDPSYCSIVTMIALKLIDLEARGNYDVFILKKFNEISKV